MRLGVIGASVPVFGAEGNDLLRTTDAAVRRLAVAAGVAFGAPGGASAKGGALGAGKAMQNAHLNCFHALDATGPLAASPV